MTTPSATYVELQVATHFSFQRGVSSAAELFSAAAMLGYPALAVTDRNTVGGLVKALRAGRETNVRLIAGCRLDLMDGSSLLVWPQDKASWSRLTRLLTIGKGRIDRKKGEKGQCFLHWEDVAAWSDGLVAALVPDEADRASEIALAQMADIFGDRGHLALTHRRRPGEAARPKDVRHLGDRDLTRPVGLVGDQGGDQTFIPRLHILPVEEAPPLLAPLAVDTALAGGEQSGEARPCRLVLGPDQQ